MTTKSDTFTVTQNPLTSPWANGTTSNQMRAAGAGAYGAATGGNYCVSIWSTADYTFDADHSASATLTNIGALADFPGVVVRWAATGGGVGYLAFYRGDNVEVSVRRFSAGVTAAVIDTIPGAFTDGDILGLEITGTSLKVYKNGVQIGTTYTDANVASGQPGVMSFTAGDNSTRIIAWTGADAVAAGPTITSVSTATPTEGGSLTVTGTSFGASQGGGGVTVGGVAMTITSWSDTSVVGTVNLGANKYGAAYNVILTDSLTNVSNTYAGVTGIQPPSGWSYVDLGTPDPDSAQRITAVSDLASGDQLSYQNPGRPSGSVTVNTDATWDVAQACHSFLVKAWTSGSGYGSAANQIVVYDAADFIGGSRGRTVLGLGRSIGLKKSRF